jgi:CIC family chloride channel protein
MIAFWISQRLQHEPIYEALARQDGIHLPTGAFREQTRALTASSAICEAPEPLAAALEARHALERIGVSALDAWPVSDDAGFRGMILRRRLEDAVARGRAEVPVSTLLEEEEGVDERATAHVHGDQPLAHVLARMGETHRSVLPVVSRADVRLLLGVVTLPDVLAAYGVEGDDEGSGRSAAEARRDG